MELRLSADQRISPFLPTAPRSRQCQIRSIQTCSGLPIAGHLDASIPALADLTKEYPSCDLHVSGYKLTFGLVSTDASVQIIFGSVYPPKGVLHVGHSVCRCYPDMYRPILQQVILHALLLRLHPWKTKLEHDTIYRRNSAPRGVLLSSLCFRHKQRTRGRDCP